MDNSKLPLRYWFVLFEEFSRGNSSALNVANTFNLNYKTVHLAEHKLRDVVKYLNERKLTGQVQADEYIHGPNLDNDLRSSQRLAAHKKREKINKKTNKKYKKKPFNNQKVVLNITDGEGGDIVKLLGASKEAITTAAVRKILKEHVAEDAELIMDSLHAHMDLKTSFDNMRFVIHNEKIAVLDKNGEPVLDKKGKPKHETKKKYVEENGDHTNAVESSNNTLKRKLNSFIKLSYKYLPLYLNEFVFMRYTRNMDCLEKIKLILDQLETKPIRATELKTMENDYPEKKWKKGPNKETKSNHSRKKITRPVDFKKS